MKLHRKLPNKLRHELNKHESDKFKTDMDSHYNYRRNYMRNNQFV
jgi:hypothetical protein